VATPASGCGAGSAHIAKSAGGMSIEHPTTAKTSSAASAAAAREPTPARGVPSPAEAFLLITAVWTQLASLEVSQRDPGTDGDGVVSPADKLAVVVHADGFNLIVGNDQKPLPRRAGELDYAALASELQTVKRANPDRKDVQIMSEDGIGYDALVRTMDASINAGFPDLSLLDAAPGS
jgi:hypothetical protein